MKHNKAFSLIELMVVIAIVGILAAVAIPSYRNYIIRSKVSEIIVMSNTVQNKIAEAYDIGTSWSVESDLKVNLSTALI